VAIQSEFFFEGLSDFWDNLRQCDRDVLKGLWDNMLRMAANLSSEILQVDDAKSLRTVPVKVRSIFVPFVFNETTENTTATRPAGFDAVPSHRAELQTVFPV